MACEASPIPGFRSGNGIVAVRPSPNHRLPRSRIERRRRRPGFFAPQSLKQRRRHGVGIGRRLEAAGRKHRSTFSWQIGHLKRDLPVDGWASGGAGFVNSIAAFLSIAYQFASS